MSFASAPGARRDLTVAITARSASMLGNEIAAVALSLRVLDAGGPAWIVAALFAAALLPLVLLAAPAGRLVDRVDSRRLLLVGGLAQTALCVVLAFSPATATGPVLGLVAALGAIEAVVSATWQALLPELVGADELPRALGLSQAGSTVATILAAPVAGLLSGWFGSGAALLVDAGTYVVVAAGALAVRTHRRPTPAAVTDADGARGGFALIVRDPVLSRVAALIGLFVVLTAMVNVVDVYLVRNTLGASSLWYGLVGGLWGVGLFAGSVVGGRLGPERMRHLLVVSAGGLAVALGAQSLVPSVVWLVPCALLGGVANGTLNLSSQTLVMTRAPRHARGRISAAITGIVSAGLVGAYLLGGVLSLAFTPRELFAAAAVAGLLVLAVLTRGLLRARTGGPGGTAGGTDATEALTAQDVAAPPESHAAKASNEYGRPRKSATRSAASAAPPLASTASR